MSDLYQSNRKLVETYRQQLQQRIISLHQTIQSPDYSKVHPQQFYLDFKDQAVELVKNETDQREIECATSDNCHLLLLKEVI